MGRTVGIIALSFEHCEELPSHHNQYLAFETIRIYYRFLLEKREENNLRIFVIAEHEIASVLNGPVGIRVQATIGQINGAEKFSTNRKLMHEAAIICKRHQIKEVIVVAQPNWKLRQCRRLAKKSGFYVIKMKIAKVSSPPTD